MYISVKQLNADLKKVNDRKFQWKMCFNGGPTKQVQKVIFNRELKKPTKRSLVFNCYYLSNLFSKPPSYYMRFQTNI